MPKKVSKSTTTNIAKLAKIVSRQAGSRGAARPSGGGKKR